MAVPIHFHCGPADARGGPPMRVDVGPSAPLGSRPVPSAAWRPLAAHDWVACRGQPGGSAHSLTKPRE